jgi:TonB family protein
MAGSRLRIKQQDSQSEWQQGIGTFKVKIVRSAQDDDDKSVLGKDEESGVTLILTRGNPTHSRPLYFPACMKCPDPEYPEMARRKRLQGVIAFFVTITVQGTAEQISLIKSFDASLIPNAVQTIRGWRFQPAIGPDGKPFAARVPLEVTYRLGP